MALALEATFIPSCIINIYVRIPFLSFKYFVFQEDLSTHHHNHHSAKKMKGQLFFFLSILSLVCVACSRTFTQILDHAAVDIRPSGINKGFKSRETTMTMVSDQGRRSNREGAENKEVKKLGSSPPSCTHKCFGCVPCEAIQVPTTKGRVGVQYANYEPEGWKCKCGPTLYTP